MASETVHAVDCMMQDDISVSSSTEDQIKMSTDLDVQTTEDGLQSKIATAIFRIVGPSDELVAYDIRTSIKANKAGSSLRVDVREHNRLQANLQSKIVSTKSELKSRISTFGREYYAIHKRMPRITDSEDYNQMLKKLKLIKHLLSHWNIRL